MALRVNVFLFQQTNAFVVATGLRINSILQRSASTKPEKEPACSKTERMAKKLREKTPIGKLDELDAGKHPYQEKEPLPPWPDNTNPHTGEVGGPRGPEPTRYGDWERKGRVTDF
ncbi:succinate dehydrogenase assembly factor 4, mitochondrial-like [Schistocerca cancellata]|uniref:succinate dehydrogenase assembly factor 4, mitochondrial-like n=1 Tax=Schistocerca cancellata TaxID=274614 RepID=UPI002118E1FC|nr:succinate dehydrogenase assembly factor 4, mitochondrial-like [Schistocerca cancellata]